VLTPCLQRIHLRSSRLHWCIPLDHSIVGTVTREVFGVPLLSSHLYHARISVARQAPTLGCKARADWAISSGWPEFPSHALQFSDAAVASSRV
jgi:hypothetical protein